MVHKLTWHKGLDNPKHHRVPSSIGHLRARIVHAGKRRILLVGGRTRSTIVVAFGLLRDWLVEYYIHV